MPKVLYAAGLILALALGFIFGGLTATPGGVNGAVQYNLNGEFAGSDDWLHFEHTTGYLGLHTTNPQSVLQLDVIDDGTFHYLQIDSEPLNTSTPPAADCDNNSEIGRIFFSNEVGNGRLFICNGATDGWLSANLN